MFDVHTHLNDDKLFEISDQIIKELGSHNIKKVIVPSCDRVMCDRVLKLVEKHENVFGALGIHPSNTEDFDKNLAQMIEKSAKNPKIVAVGEIGFDNHYPQSNLAVQEEVFAKQLEIAKKVKLPVILHLRDAWEEFFGFLGSNRHLFSNGVDVHCFDGDVEIAKKLLDEGFFISLTALSVENKPRIREMIKYLPLDRIMLETDSPYLLPHDFRHTEAFNTPKNVNFVAALVCEYKNIALEELDQKTTENALKLFKKIGEYDAKSKK